MAQVGPDLASLLQLYGNTDMSELAALLAAHQHQSPQQAAAAQQQAQSDLLGSDLASLLGASGMPGLDGPGSQGLYDPALKGLLLQEAALSLAATMEQQRKQQQLAAALQLRALQQQQEFAALQQQLTASMGGPSAQHQAAAQQYAYTRAFSNDLEYRSAAAQQPVHPHAAAYQRAASVDLEGMGSPMAPRLAGPHGHHAGPVRPGLAHLNAPQRSYSSEQLEPRRHPLQRGVPLHLSNPPPARGPPQSRPSFPSSRNPGPSGGARASGNQRSHGTSRHAGATAKAPCWAAPDWHPLKAVLSSSGSTAAPSGTGVFLPHLADDMGKPGGKDKAPSRQPNLGSRSSSEETRASTVASADANTATSPACSVDGASTCGSDPWSRSSTLDMEGAGVVRSAPGGTAAALGAAGTPVHTLSPVAEQRVANPLTGAEEEADEFGSLAKELAELMSKQVMVE